MNREQVKQRLIKRIGKGLEKEWYWQGTRFTKTARIGVTSGYSVYVIFTADHCWVKADMQTESEYGIPDGERRFKSDNCIEEMVEWVAEKAIEVYEIVSKRVAPYQQGHEEYLRALKGSREA